MTVACASNLRQIGLAAEMYSLDNGNSFLLPFEPDTGMGGPEGYAWPYLLIRDGYATPAVFACPAMEPNPHYNWRTAVIGVSSPWQWTLPSYGYNWFWAGGGQRGGGLYNAAKPYKRTILRNSSNFIHMADTVQGDWMNGYYMLDPLYLGSYGKIWPIHRGSANILWGDGHVSAVASGQQQVSPASSAALYIQLQDGGTGQEIDGKWRSGIPIP